MHGMLGPSPERAIRKKRIGLSAPLGIGAGEEHVQAAAAGAEAVEQGAGAEQARRETVERRQQAGADQAAQRPGAEMERGDLVAGAEADAVQPGIAGREQVEVGNVAIAEQAAAELGIGLGVEVLPAMDRDPFAVLQGGERPADIGEDRRGGGEAAIGLLGGADPVIDGVEPGEERAVMVDDRGAEAGHRAGAGDDRHSGLLRPRVERADAGDEGAGVGEVEIVGAGGDAGLGDAIVLALERADAVDDDVGRGRGERRAGIAGDVERMRLGQVGGVEAGDERLGLRLRAAGDQQPDPGVARERARDVGAEIAVAADDEDAERHAGVTIRRPLWCGSGETPASRRSPAAKAR